MNAKAVQKIVSGKGNKGNKPSITRIFGVPTPVTPNTGEVNQISNYNSANATIPFTVTDTTGRSYIISQMINTSQNLFAPSDNYGNYFYFSSTTIPDSQFHTGINPQTITWNSNTYTIGSSFITPIDGKGGVNYYTTN